MRTYVYKMRPTDAQVAVLTDTLETCRRLYNHALAERKTA
jgi:Helix-turn-helix domain